MHVYLNELLAYSPYRAAVYRHGTHFELTPLLPLSQALCTY